ncbi:MAG: Ig-like domain-containing protein [Flavobacteriales bacterium]|nr:Ig-like domain-containing protein [Flavobacteriales bacterium]
MKKLYPTILVLFAITFSFSCKKEISPDLEVTVVDANDQPVNQVWVKTSVPGAIFGILNAEVVDSSQTDVFGKAYFQYSNTVLLDLALYKTANDLDIIDSASVLLETKRKSPKSSNRTEKKLVFR